MRPSPRALAIAAALTGAAAYGLNIPAAKIASDMGVAPLALIVLRSAAMIAGMAVAAPMFGQPLHPGKSGIAPLAGLGLATAVTGIGYLSSLAFLPVSLAVVIFYSFPLWLILIAWFRDGRISAPRLGGFALAFCGIVMVVSPGSAAVDWRGAALALTASVAAALMFELTPLVKLDRYRKILWAQAPSLLLAAMAMTVVGVPVSLTAFQAAAWPVLITCLGFYIGFALQIIATPFLSPAAAGLLFLLEPVVAISASVLWLGEAMTPLKLAGMLLVLAGLTLDVAAGAAQRRGRSP